MALDPNGEAKATFAAYWTGRYVQRGPNTDHQVVIAGPAAAPRGRARTAPKTPKAARPAIPVIYCRS